MKGTAPWTAAGNCAFMLLAVGEFTFVENVETENRKRGQTEMCAKDQM